MSFVSVVPQDIQAAAHEIGEVGERLSEAGRAALTRITSIPAAAADEVSRAAAGLFNGHGLDFELQRAARTTQIQEQFNQALSAAGNVYGLADKGAASLLRGGLDAEAALRNAQHEILNRYQSQANQLADAVSDQAHRIQDFVNKVSAATIQANLQRV